MTIIAWDGKTLAADKQGTIAGMAVSCQKVRKLANGDVVGSTGCGNRALRMQKWYEDGADPANWPQCQREDEFSRLIVAKASGGLVYYDWIPVEHVVSELFMAFGAGRDYAMGAMAMGSTAERAVEIASAFDITCGLGVDAFIPGAE